MSITNVKSTPSPSVSSAESAKTQRTAPSAARAYDKNAASNPTTPATTREAANVQISPQAREMSLAKKIAEETPDVRADRVADIKNKIAKGTYAPDARKIAHGMVREAIQDDLATE